LSDAPHALGLSAAPHAVGASAGLSAAPHAAGASAGLSLAPHALPQPDADSFLFHPKIFESAMSLYPLILFSDWLCLLGYVYYSNARNNIEVRTFLL
jgi:hypothetical protein